MPVLNCEVPSIGLGTWAFGGGYDWGVQDESSAVRTVHAALDAGICFIDTAPIYGESERIIGRALQGRRKQVILASKGGLIKNGSWTDHNASACVLRSQLEQSLRLLRTDYIDLYQLHYPDPHIPLEDVLETLIRFVQQGFVRAIGLCNVSAQDIYRAAAVAPVASVQNEYSLLHRVSGPAVWNACREAGCCFIGYGALCGGILSGKYSTSPNLRRADARNYFYKCYRGEEFIRAQQVVSRVKAVAAQHQVSPSAVAVAWVLAHGQVGIALCGARTPQQVAQNTRGLTLQLTPQEIAFLETN